MFWSPTRSVGYVRKSCVGMFDLDFVHFAMRTSVFCGIDRFMRCVRALPLGKRRLCTHTEDEIKRRWHCCVICCKSYDPLQPGRISSIPCNIAMLLVQFLFTSGQWSAKDAKDTDKSPMPVSADSESFKLLLRRSSEENIPEVQQHCHKSSHFDISRSSVCLCPFPPNQQSQQQTHLQ